MRVDIRRLSLSVSAGSKTGQVIPFVCWSPSSIGNAGRQICNICDGKYQEEFKTGMKHFRLVESGNVTDAFLVRLF